MSVNYYKSLRDETRLLPPSYFSLFVAQSSIARHPDYQRSRDNELPAYDLNEVLTCSETPSVTYLPLIHRWWILVGVYSRRNESNYFELFQNSSYSHEGTGLSAYRSDSRTVVSNQWR